MDGLPLAYTLAIYLFPLIYLVIAIIVLKYDKYPLLKTIFIIFLAPISWVYLIAQYECNPRKRSDRLFNKYFQDSTICQVSYYKNKEYSYPLRTKICIYYLRTRLFDNTYVPYKILKNFDDLNAIELREIEKQYFNQLFVENIKDIPYE